MGFRWIRLGYGVVSKGKVSGLRQPQGKVKVKVKVRWASRIEG